MFDAIQDTTTSWSDCSDCAGGAVTTSYFTSPFQTTPSLSGSSRQFSISGPAWASALWIKKFGNQDQATHMFWDFYVYFDSGSAAGTWSAEYDMWQSVSGQEFMVGSQCDFGKNEWDLWDSSVGHWISSGLPCPRFTPNTWHHIQWDVQRVSSTQYRYNTLFVDDQAYALNKTFSTNPTNWSDSMGVQWQLDQNGSGVPLNEWVDKVKLTIW